MQVRTKIVLLTVFAAGCWFAQSYLFLGPGPTMTADMAVEQFKNNSANYETLRVVDTGKNFLALVAVLAFTFVLFFREIWGLLGLVTGEAGHCHHCGQAHPKHE